MHLLFLEAFHWLISPVLSINMEDGFLIDTLFNNGTNLLHSSIHQYRHSSGMKVQILLSYASWTLALLSKHHINPGHIFDTLLYISLSSLVRWFEHSLHSSISWSITFPLKVLNKKMHLNYQAKIAIQKKQKQCSLYTLCLLKAKEKLCQIGDLWSE